MDCARLFDKIGYVVSGYYKNGVYVQLIDQQLDDIFEGGNMVPQENEYI